MDFGKPIKGTFRRLFLKCRKFFMASVIII